MLLIQSKKLTITQKLVKLKKKITTDRDHDKYITTQEFKLISENFTARLAQANLASKSDVSNLLKKTDSDDKLKNSNKNVTSNKNELNQLSKKITAISTKRLTKDLINKFSILNGVKYFSSRIFQNYLVFIPAKKYMKYFSGMIRIF